MPQKPMIQVLSRECIWVRDFEWDERQADALVDCCPELARQLLTHNERVRMMCR